jgi:hypothetical protein
MPRLCRIAQKSVVCTLRHLQKRGSIIGRALLRRAIRKINSQRNQVVLGSQVDERSCRSIIRKVGKGFECLDCSLIFELIVCIGQIERGVERIPDAGVGRCPHNRGRCIGRATQQLIRHSVRIGSEIPRGRCVVPKHSLSFGNTRTHDTRRCRAVIPRNQVGRKLRNVAITGCQVCQT